MTAGDRKGVARPIRATEPICVQHGCYHCAYLMACVPRDLPSDVHAVLTQLAEAGEAAVDSAELDTARQTVATAETVSRNKIPECDLRAQLLHGCEQVHTALNNDHPDAAAEYFRAMGRRLAAVDDC
jgi:hypothetical protein